MTERPNGFKINAKIVDGFFAILDSLDGASTLRMLIDHKEQIWMYKLETTKIAKKI